MIAYALVECLQLQASENGPRSCVSAGQGLYHVYDAAQMS